MSKVSLPQGTRDFNATVVRKRNYIFNTIRTVFELYGFQPLETPVMENLETLMGKYGEEGDKLIFRILDSGNPFEIDFYRALFKYLLDFREQILNVNPEFESFKSIDFLKSLLDHPTVLASLAKELNTNPDLGKKYLSIFKKEVSSKALRYDLTIPFARYVAMNHNQLVMPFKRYQIQPVWRADRPQRGRYREFYQCDADVVGSTSLLNELELVYIYATVFEKLGIEVEIRINSRKILLDLATIIERIELPYLESTGYTSVDEKRYEGMRIIATAIDKIDKIGESGVIQELEEKGITKRQIKIITEYLNINGSNSEKLIQLNTLLSKYDGILGDIIEENRGLNEIKYILNQSSNLPIFLDFTLSRGLNYYTGIIFEIKAKNVQIGSIGGGGRYDDLTGTFGVPNIPGVGISFGVDRIYDVMEELKLFPEEVQTGTKLLFFNLGNEESKKAFSLMQELRKRGISCEMFHEQTKMDKQFKYAEKKQIPYAVIIGTKEMEAGTCNLKDLRNGEQQSIQQDELLSYIFK